MSSNARGKRGNGRGQGSTRPGKNGKSPKGNPKSSGSFKKFQGACEALKGRIFDCSDYRQADNYATTLKKLKEYVGAEFKNGGDVVSCIVAQAKVTIPAPTAPTIVDPSKPTPTEAAELRLYDKRLDNMLKREAILDSNIQRLYSLIIGQSTDLLQTKLKQQTTWSTVETNQDGIALLNLIRGAVHRFEDQKFLPLALCSAKYNLYSFRQQSMSNDEYLQRFNALADIAISYDGQLQDGFSLEHIVQPLVVHWTIQRAHCCPQGRD